MLTISALALIETSLKWNTPYLNLVFIDFNSGLKGILVGLKGSFLKT